MDNATCPNPVRIRWLLDGGFGDVANVAYLIEMGYDVYTIAHNGKTTQALLKGVPENASWTQVGARTQALDTDRHRLGDCPYPVRLTLLRWPVGEEFRHSFTKLHVRSPAGIRLLGQFALVFWPNFVRWAADWLAAQAQGRFAQVLRRVHTQVRIAANTPAVVLTNASGQMLEFAADGPYAGVQIRLDGPFAYQFPMPLFQTWEQLWPASSESVKEQLSTIFTAETSPSPAEVLFTQTSANLPGKVSEFGLVERLSP